MWQYTGYWSASASDDLRTEHVLNRIPDYVRCEWQFAAARLLKSTFFVRLCSIFHLVAIRDLDVSSVL
jgi:hypothetical protein